jgi:hypothetical protein
MLLASLGSKPARTVRRTRNSRIDRQIQLGFERLEDRRVLSVNYYGGPLLTDVHVVSVYLGSAWNQGSNSSFRAGMDQFLQMIVQSHL